MSRYSAGFIGFTPLERAKAIEDLSELIALKEKNREAVEQSRGFEIEKDRTFDKLFKKPLDDVLTKAFLLRDNRIPLKHLEGMKERNSINLANAQTDLQNQGGTDPVIIKLTEFYQFNGSLLDKKIKLETLMERRDNTKNITERNALDEELKKLIPGIQNDEKKLLVDYPEFNVPGVMAAVNEVTPPGKSSSNDKGRIIKQAGEPLPPASGPVTRGHIAIGELPPGGQRWGIRSPDNDLYRQVGPPQPMKKTGEAAARQTRELWAARSDFTATGNKSPAFVWMDNPDNMLLGQMRVNDSADLSHGPVIWCGQHGVLAEGRMKDNGKFVFFPLNPNDDKQTFPFEVKAEMDASLVMALIHPNQRPLVNASQKQLSAFIIIHLATFGLWGREYTPEAFSEQCTIRDAASNPKYVQAVTAVIDNMPKQLANAGPQLGSGAKSKKSVKKPAEIVKEIAMKVGPDGEYGDLIIDLPALYNSGRIVALRKNTTGGAVLDEVAGEGLVGLLTKRVMKTTLAKANPATLKQLERLRKLANAPAKPTPKKPKGGQIIVADAGDLAQRLKVATGIYNAGNRSAKNVELITELAKGLMDKGRMSPAKYRQTLETYTVK